MPACVVCPIVVSEEDPHLIKTALKIGRTAVVMIAQTQVFNTSRQVYVDLIEMLMRPSWTLQVADI